MNKGVWYAVVCYGLWGFFPFYWKVLHLVPAGQILAHRILWSFLFVVLVVAARKEWTRLRDSLNRRTVLIYTAASVLLSVNWLTYIWSVNSGFIIESSLGYFINPLVNVLLGVLFMGERLRPMQWAPVGLAAAGVIYLTASYGSLPWISLVLAFSFGLYGLVKKAAPLGALHGITLETGLLCLPALGYLLLVEGQGAGAFGHVGALETFMLAFSGVVTAIPLLLFAGSARRIPLSMMGIIQYISPTLQFLIGIWAFNEAFSGAKLVGFVIIWLALLLYSVEGLMERRRVMHAQAAQV
jgi:chloramphenicol-sensitive protein RarD